MLGPQEPSDEQLIAAVATGDAAAFDALIVRHGTAMRRFARALAPRDEADDVLQDALLDLYRGAATYAQRASVRAWLFQLVRHRAFHHRKARNRSGTPTEECSLAELGREAGHGAEATPIERGLVADAALDLETRDALRAALATLDDDAREVLWLRDVEGLRGAEAAAALGLELGAMKTRLHKARMALMAALRSDEGEHG